MCRNSPANSNTVQPSRATTKLTWPGLAGWLRTPSGRGHDTERQLERRTCRDKKARDGGGGGGDFKEQPHCGKAARKHKVFVSRPKAHGSDRLPFGHLFAELPSIPCWCLLHTVRANSPPPPPPPPPVLSVLDQCPLVYGTGTAAMTAQLVGGGGWGTLIIMKPKAPVWITSFYVKKNCKKVRSIIHPVDIQLYMHTVTHASFVP